MSIKPTVGRVVWFYWGDKTDDQTPMAAVVAYVWTDRMVNLAVFDHNGVPFSKTSVTLVQEGDNVQVGGPFFCTWMPYQIGQAKKHEKPHSEAVHEVRDPEVGGGVSLGQTGERGSSTTERL